MHQIPSPHGVSSIFANACESTRLCGPIIFEPKLHLIEVVSTHGWETLTWSCLCDSPSNLRNKPCFIFGGAKNFFTF